MTVTEGRPETLVLNPSPFATLRVDTAGANPAAAGRDAREGATLTGEVELAPLAAPSFRAESAEAAAGPARVTVTTDGVPLTGSLEALE